MSTPQTFEPTVAAQTRLCRLDQLGRGDVAFAGGKGANLGELRSAGLRFLWLRDQRACVRRFCDAAGCATRSAACSGLDVEDSGALEAASHLGARS